jgi:hypothetical protein
MKGLMSGGDASTRAPPPRRPFAGGAVRFCKSDYVPVRGVLTELS